MRIEELKEGEWGCKVEEKSCHDDVSGKGVVASDAKRVLIGAGARVLFYPTLLYNVLRNKLQTEFRWWDRVDEFVLLGAVPFPADVPRLKDLGVRGVVTLNEPYETLVPTSLYHAYGIDHLMIPTRDYLFAPSMIDICKAVDFIHRNSLCRYTTYVHCKAGRGRSTTIVLCYLVKHKQMAPDAAFNYVRSIRPRVLLAPSQRQAVQEYYHLMVKRVGISDVTNLTAKPPNFSLTRELMAINDGYTVAQDLVAFDDGSVVMVTDSDLDGYDPSLESGGSGSEIWADLSVVYRVRFAGQAALARISCLWLRCGAQHNKICGDKLARRGSCSIGASQLAGLSVDIHVY